MKFDNDQLAALDVIMRGDNVFLTGPAGTGKSCVTCEAVMHLLGRKRLAICATTGIAALNLRDQMFAHSQRDINAITVYRWAGIGLGPRDGESFADALTNIRKLDRGWRNAEKRIACTDVLLVDEISMLPGRILAFLNYVCQRVRGSKVPFGGIQVVGIGDFLQLPPVSKTGRYDWAFLSEIWLELAFTPIHLREIHRQDDSGFVRLLNEFREGILSTHSAELLEPRTATRFPDSKILRLLTHNVQVDKWNNYQLGTIDEPEFCYDARSYGPTFETDWLFKNMTTPKHLVVKRGARVMITKNISDPEGGGLLAANGEVGDVTDCHEDSVWVRLDSGRLMGIGEHTWEFDPNKTKTGYVIQIPLRLAYACTIHKSQGLTLDRIMVDLRATREPGQAYVALSRVRTLDGLYLKDSFKWFLTSPQAVIYHRQIKSGYEANQIMRAPIIHRES